MYEDKINDIIQNIKNDIEKDKLEISRIRKEMNKLKRCIKESTELKLYNKEFEEELLLKKDKIVSIKEKISNKKKAIYRLNIALNLLK